MKRGITAGLLLLLGVLSITIGVIGFVVFVTDSDPSPALRVIQASTFLLMVIAAVVLVVLLLGFFPQLIGRTGTPVGRLGSLSLWLSERPRLLRRLYFGFVILLLVVGALFFGATEPGA